MRTATTIAFALVATMAVAQDRMSPQDFATMAASSDMFEIESSQLALQKSQSDDLKQFAQQMIDDHTKASADLKAAAAQDGVTVPAAMTDKHASQVEMLKGVSGDAFDVAYAGAQLAAHQEGLDLMQSYAGNGESPALKAHAAKSAPIIEAHLRHVEAMGTKK